MNRVQLTTIGSNKSDSTTLQYTSIFQFSSWTFSFVYENHRTCWLKKNLFEQNTMNANFHRNWIHSLWTERTQFSLYEKKTFMTRILLTLKLVYAEKWGFDTLLTSAAIHKTIYVLFPHQLVHLLFLLTNELSSQHQALLVIHCKYLDSQRKYFIKNPNSIE